MEKQFQSNGSASGSGVLAASMLLANLNCSSIYDCLIQAAIGGVLGGAFWIGTQALNDYRKEKMERKRNAGKKSKRRFVK